VIEPNYMVVLQRPVNAYFTHQLLFGSGFN